MAINLKALEATPLVCSVIGDDEAGKTLLQLMQEEGLEVAGLISSNRRKTTNTKLRTIIIIVSLLLAVIAVYYFTMGINVLLQQ